MSPETHRLIRVRFALKQWSQYQRDMIDLGNEVAGESEPLADELFQQARALEEPLADLKDEHWKARQDVKRSA